MGAPGRVALRVREVGDRLRLRSAPTPALRDGVQGRRWTVGQAWRRVWIADRWRVLDIGSGHRPLARADVLLDRFPEDDVERAGRAIARDARLVVGDAQAMPFADGAFDYVVASHVAQYVEDPRALCRELARVDRAGYLEAPGPLGDLLLREPAVRWCVRRRGRGLDFRAVSGPRPLGTLGDAVYALVYLGLERPGHRTWVARRRPGRVLARMVRYLVLLAIQSPPLRPAFYTQIEWRYAIPVVVCD